MSMRRSHEVTEYVAPTGLNWCGWHGMQGVRGRTPAKSLFVPYLSDSPTVVARRHATALVQARSQIPATGMFGHLVHTATLPGPCRCAYSVDKVIRTSSSSGGSARSVAVTL